MARFTYIDTDSARDNETGETLQVVTLSVEYVHLSTNQLIAEYGALTLMFTPIRHLEGLMAHGIDDPARQRRLVIERRELESGHPYIVVVAVQAAEDSEEYVECIGSQSI